MNAEIVAKEFMKFCKKDMAQSDINALSIEKIRSIESIPDPTEETIKRWAFKERDDRNPLLLCYENVRVGNDRTSTISPSFIGLTYKELLEDVTQTLVREYNDSERSNVSERSKLSQDEDLSKIIYQRLDENTGEISTYKKTLDEILFNGDDDKLKEAIRDFLWDVDRRLDPIELKNDFLDLRIKRSPNSLLSKEENDFADLVEYFSDNSQKANEFLNLVNILDKTKLSIADDELYTKYRPSRIGVEGIINLVGKKIESEVRRSQNDQPLVSYSDTHKSWTIASGGKVYALNKIDYEKRLEGIGLDDEISNIKYKTDHEKGIANIFKNIFGDKTKNIEDMGIK